MLAPKPENFATMLRIAGSDRALSASKARRDPQAREVTECAAIFGLSYEGVYHSCVARLERLAKAGDGGCRGETALGFAKSSTQATSLLGLASRAIDWLSAAPVTGPPHLFSHHFGQGSRN